jgi:predicted flap endonuclease-1-like 5' DNA nuclease
VERATIASTTPRLADVPGAPAVAAYGTLDPFALARAEPNEVARSAGISAVDAGRWIEAARLVTLHGIGAPNAARLRAAGISTVSELAAADPESLAGRLAARGTPIASARLRVWVRAARQAAANPAP